MGVAHRPSGAVVGRPRGYPDSRGTNPVEGAWYPGEIRMDPDPPGPPDSRLAWVMVHWGHLFKICHVLVQFLMEQSLFLKCK